MNVIGIVGYPASGKGEFSRIAAENGIPVVVMGDIIRNRTKAKGLELTDEHVGATARELRAELGMDAVAILTAEEVKRLDTETAVIDGIRGDAEVNYFRSVFESFTLIFIKADFEIRLSRMQGRGRADDSVTAEALSARDAREESFGLARAVSVADITLVNETERESFEEEIRNTIRSLA